MGYIDPDSGTHFYENGDPIATTAIATVLNQGQTAEHNARLSDRARIEQLENDALQIHTITTSGFMTLNPGYTFATDRVQVIRRIGTRIEFALRIVKSSGALVHGVSVGFVNFEWRPLAGSEWQLVGLQSGGSAASSAVGAVVQADGDIIALDPNGVSTILTISGFYHMV